MTDHPTGPVTTASPSGIADRLKGLGDIGDIRTWLTVAIVTGFFVVYGVNWWTSGHATGEAEGAATKTLDLMNGALIAQFTGVIGYWIGSSRGSDVKTAVLSSQMPSTDPTT